MTPFIVALLLAQDTTQARRLPSVAPVAGDVLVWRSAAEKVESVRSAVGVGAGDRLGAPKGASARFAAEGSLLVGIRGVRASREEGLGLEREGERVVLRFFRGSVAVESYEREVELQTPFGLAVGSDVYFVVDAGEKSARVLVLEGVVRFTNDLGEVAVPEGMFTTIEKGAAPAAASEAPADARDAWEAPGNLLANPGVEEGAWGNGDVGERDAAVRRRGKFSQSFALSETPSPKRILPDCRIEGTLKPGSRYLLRFFVRTDGLEVDGSPGRLNVTVDRSGAGTWGEWDPKTHVGRVVARSEGRWAARHIVFEATGPDAIFAVHVGDVAGAYSGTVWFDDFYLGECPPTER